MSGHFFCTIDTKDHILTFFRCQEKHRLALLLQPQSRTIIVFTVAHRFRHSQEEGRSKVSNDMVFSRFTYDGKCLTTSYAPCSYDLHILTTSHPLLPVDKQGTFALKVKGLQSGEANLHRMQFNEHEYNFIAIPGYQSSMFLHTSTSWWNDAVYIGMTMAWKNNDTYETLMRNSR